MFLRRSGVLKTKALNSSVLFAESSLRWETVRWTIYKVLSVFLVFLLFLITATMATAAAEPTITVTPIQNEITAAGEALFSVTITNNDVSTQAYTLYGLEIAWSVDPEVKRFSLAPGASKTTIVQVRSLSPLKPSTYSLKLYIDTSNDAGDTLTARYIRNLVIILYPDVSLDYIPSIRATVDMNEKINPQEPVSIKLFLENGNPLNLTGMSIRIQSDLAEFEQNTIVDLPSLAKKTVELTISPNPYQAPQEHTLFVVFERAGQTIKVVEKTIEIIPVISSFSVDLRQEKSFLKTFTTLTVKNGGNVLNAQEIKVPTSFWASLFTSRSATVKNDGGQRHLTWELALSPNESQAVHYTTNYRIPLYIVLVLSLFSAFYWYVQSPVRLTKSAITTKTGEDNTLLEIKVTIETKNLGRKPIKDVTITDTVPGIANIEKSLEIGTLKPQNIRHTRNGTIVTWSLAELDGHEHRIITYKLRAKLNILGEFSLPRATIEYAQSRGQHGKAYSNIFRLNS